MVYFKSVATVNMYAEKFSHLEPWKSKSQNLYTWLQFLLYVTPWSLPRLLLNLKTFVTGFDKTQLRRTELRLELWRFQAFIVL